MKIKEFVGENISEFHFSETTLENIENEIKKLHVSKKGTLLNIFCQNVLETFDVPGPIVLNI